MTTMGSSERRAHETERLLQTLILDYHYRIRTAIRNQPNPILLEQEPRGLWDICGGIMETKVGLEVVSLAFCYNLAMLVSVELVHHYPIVAR